MAGQTGSALREAARCCLVQAGLTFGPHGKHATAEDYLRAAFQFTAVGDCFSCAASFDIQKAPCDNHVPIVDHVELIPSCITWTGWCAVDKTAPEARPVWDHVKQLEATGAFLADGRGPRHLQRRRFLDRRPPNRRDQGYGHRCCHPSLRRRSDRGDQELAPGGVW